MLRISYAVTACNEHVELDRLLEMLKNNIRPEDEVIIQLDTNSTQEVKDVCAKYSEYTLVIFALNNDFARFKNNLSKHCTKEFIFQIDADEYPHPYLLASLPAIVDYNYTVDAFVVPRINTVDGLTEQHIKQWGWNVNDKGWVNFPDYQWRIWKNSNKIQWVNKVHERLSGFDTHSSLPMSEEYCLFHPKDIKRQEKQNQFYSTL